MAAVLARIGYTLSDKVEHVSRVRDGGRGACPRYATVVSGLPRMCEYPAWASNQIARCVRGETTMTFGLQLSDAVRFKRRPVVGAREPLFEPPSDETARVAACVENLRAAAEGTLCRLMITSMRIEPIKPNRTMSDSCDLANSPPKPPWQLAQRVAQSERVMVQTLAVGRTWEWARRFHPAPRAFVRARVDSMWCLPEGAADEEALVVLDWQSFRAPGVGGVSVDGRSRAFAGDNFGLVSARLASAYFEAWRVWTTVDCTKICLAGAATAECAISYLALRMCSGEQPLTAHLCAHAGGGGDNLAPGPSCNGSAAGLSASSQQQRGRVRPWWTRLERGLIQPFLSPLNQTHARRRGGRAPVTIQQAVALVMKRERDAIGCRSCVREPVAPEACARATAGSAESDACAARLRRTCCGVDCLGQIAMQPNDHYADAATLRAARATRRVRNSSLNEPRCARDWDRADCLVDAAKRDAELGVCAFAQPAVRHPAQRLDIL
jgi:hypothetical protein